MRFIWGNKNSISPQNKQNSLPAADYTVHGSSALKVWTSGISSYVDQQVTPSDPAALV